MRSLFAKLVDDAGLFPPEQLPMPAALERHRADEVAGHPMLSGRFVCPAARLGELLTALDDDSRPVSLSVIVSPFSGDGVSGALAACGADSRLDLAGLEGPIAPSGVPAVPGLPAFVELPVMGEWHSGLDDVASAGLGVKVRCGGVTADLFPSASQLGDLVGACAAADVPFKATAGLHHAVRARDERTGFVHHGFLNLLVAALRAADGGSGPDLAAALDCTDGSALAAEAAVAGDDAAAQARRLFVSYGSCSTSEPIEDLRLLGLDDDLPARLSR